MDVNICVCVCVAEQSTPNHTQYVVNIFTPNACRYNTYTQTLNDDDDTQTRYNQAKLCGIPLLMVQHVLFTHWNVTVIQMMMMMRFGPYLWTFVSPLSLSPYLFQSFSHTHISFLILVFISKSVPVLDTILPLLLAMVFLLLFLPHFHCIHSLIHSNGVCFLFFIFFFVSSCSQSF